MLTIPHSYHLCSAEQCRRMDERTINDFGIDGFTLMEIAGTRAADFIEYETAVGSGLFLCGKGNNAGDALVVARLLSQKGYSVTICFTEGTEALSPETQKNLDLIQKLEGDIHILRNEDDIPDFDEFDFIVDGLLGTGLQSDVREPYASLIHRVNESLTPVFSMDLPSGLHPDTGRVMGAAIQADFTLSFGALKTGFYLNQGYDHTGIVILCELPFPNQYRETAAFLIDESWVQEHQAPVQKRSHKYDGGMLYIIAGSEGLTGAAILSAKAAWATGIGAVTLISPKGLLAVYEENLPQIIKKPVGESGHTSFSADHLQQVQQILREKTGAVLIGPGLGRNAECLEFTQALLPSLDMPVVIDADALYALSQKSDWKKHPDSEWILTPHAGELSKLLGTAVDDSFDRLIQACSTSKSTNTTILSKGFPSIIGTSDGKAYLTGYDTRVFSRAGFGDVLAGKTAALFIQQKSPTLACTMALLNGHRKAVQFLQEHPDDALEPINII